MKVVFLPETLGYFNELVTLLYEKEYFRFEASARDYVESLISDIETSLHIRTAKTVPPHFNRYGKRMQYATFSKSKATQWYMFFTVYQSQGEIVYLVRHISNNHTDAQHLKH